MSDDKIKVLLVDDEEFILLAYSTKLKNMGYEVLTVNNGADVLKVARDNMPDVVLLDLMLPEKNGFEILEEMKNDSTLSSIPVLVTSNLSQENDIQKVTKLGAVGYLVKSDITFTDMISKIEEVVGR